MSTIKDKNILIVDDDEDLTNLFQTFLEYDGYKVDTFTDPIDALYSFKKNTYDLVLLEKDHHHPNQSINRNRTSALINYIFPKK